jgi:hypothetical protein
MLAVGIFQKGRSSYMKLTGLDDTDEDCSCLTYIQVGLVDLLIPVLMLMATFILGVTRSYPLVKKAAGATCAGESCTDLEITEDSLLSFWFFCWFCAGIWQFFKAIGMFYFLRSSLPANALVLMDLRKYANREVEYESVGTGQAPQVHLRTTKTVSTLDYVFSFILIAGCFVLALGSIAYAF